MYRHNNIEYINFCPSNIQPTVLDNLLREGSFFKTEADRIRKMAVDMQVSVASSISITS